MTAPRKVQKLSFYMESLENGSIGFNHYRKSVHEINHSFQFSKFLFIQFLDGIKKFDFFFAQTIFIQQNNSLQAN